MAVTDKDAGAIVARAGGGFGPSTRLALFYGALFTVIGVQLPFWPAWLASRDLTPTQIGLIIAAGTVARAVLGPWLARTGTARIGVANLVLVLAAAGGTILLLNIAARGFWPLLVIGTVFTTLFFTTLPLAEHLAMRSVSRHGGGYGRVRLWGSVTFILAVALTGEAVEAFPVDVILWLAIGGAVLTIAAAWALPQGRDDHAAGAGGAVGFTWFLSNRPFLLFLFAAGLIGASHAALYAFATLHWLAAGLAPATIAWLWAAGVLAEILVFAVSRHLVATVGAAPLLAVAGMVAMLRWVVLALTVSPALLMLAQVAHALTFGAAHLAAVHYIAERAPPALAPTAQTVYAAAVLGPAIGLATAASGPLFEHAGAIVFWPMAALAAIGATAAVLLARQPGLRGEQA